jgi:hypothetical protein
MAFFFKILGCGGRVIQGAVGYLFFGGLIKLQRPSTLTVLCPMARLS